MNLYKKKGLISAYKENAEYYYRHSKFDEEPSYFIPQNILDHIRENKKIEPIDYSNLDIEKLIEIVDKLVERRVNDVMPFEKFISEVSCLITNNKHLPFCDKILQCNLNDNDLALLIIFEASKY